jgi:uncharacterized small protein (DUF1192 family)
MTDSPRKEPRPDRLPQIKQRFGIGIPGTGVIGHTALLVDIAWLVAEVERLRAELREYAPGRNDPGAPFGRPADD